MFVGQNKASALPCRLNCTVNNQKQILKNTAQYISRQRLTIQACVTRDSIVNKLIYKSKKNLQKSVDSTFSMISELESVKSFGIAGQQKVQIPECTVKREQLPQHVAFIMDGNSRWARKSDVPTSEGHRQGLDALITMLQCSKKWGINAVTVFAFSTENWQRSQTEVDFLMGLFRFAFEQHLKTFVESGVRINFIGNIEMCPDNVREAALSAEAATAHNAELTLTVALSYGGRHDIVNATKKICQLVQNGEIQPQQITEELVCSQLSTSCLPPTLQAPDLVIRTSGEQRLSNFLLWEAAYSELFFSPVLWPEFTPLDYLKALESYSQRQRRFGQRTEAEKKVMNGAEYSQCTDSQQHTDSQQNTDSQQHSDTAQNTDASNGDQKRVNVALKCETGNTDNIGNQLDQNGRGGAQKNWPAQSQQQVIGDVQNGSVQDHKLVRKIDDSAHNNV